LPGAEHSEARWLRGEDVFVAATLDEVPAEEMAAAFDQLRPH
jgi:hypothetical protein